MLKKVAAVSLLVFAQGVWADIAVVVHPSNGASLDQNAIKKLYLGKSKSFPDGNSATAVNQDGTPAFDEFNDKVVGKSSSQLNAYWSKLVFTGKGTPPDKLANDQALIDFVAANPGAIGYVSAASASDKVKVVATF